MCCYSPQLYKRHNNIKKNAKLIISVDINDCRLNKIVIYFFSDNDITLYIRSTNDNHFHFQTKLQLDKNRKSTHHFLIFPKCLQFPLYSLHIPIETSSPSSNELILMLKNIHLTCMCIRILILKAIGFFSIFSSYPQEIEVNIKELIWDTIYF